jgi:hypothetical protein
VDCVIFQAQQRFCGFESFPGSEGTGANYIWCRSDEETILTWR